MPFTLGADRKIFQSRYMNIMQTEFLDKDGKPQVWEWMRSARPVFVFPITPEQNVVLIKNFRVPLKEYVIEMPAGLQGRDEKEEDVAHRELLEETGYQADRLIRLPKFPLSGGSSDGIGVCFIATNAKKIAEMSGDATEDISVFEIPMDQLIEFYLKEAPTTLFSSNILVAFALARHLNIRG